MSWNLLSDTLSWGDRLNYVGTGVIMGMVVVFAVLILLWLILEAFGAFACRGQKKPAESAVAPTPLADEPAPVLPQTNDEEIVAAITAALSVYMEEAKASNPAIKGFRVVSFKKVGNAAHWNQN